MYIPTLTALGRKLTVIVLKYEIPLVKARLKGMCGCFSE